MELIDQGLRFEWVRETTDESGADDAACLRLTVAREEGAVWRPLGTGESMLSTFAAAAPDIMKRAALQLFARLLHEAGFDRQEALLTHLLWYTVEDREIIEATLSLLEPADTTQFLMDLAQVDPLAAQRAIARASDAQLAAITTVDAIRLIRHPNPQARAPLLIALRQNSKRLPGLKQ